jgi:hypothetical protein
VHLIVSPNDPSFVAHPQAITVKTGKAFGIKLSGELVSSAQPGNFTVSMKPSHGTLSSAGDDLTYTSEPGYTGNDSFAFFVGNGNMRSTPAVVSICVVPVDSTTLSNGSFENGAFVGGSAVGYNLDGWQVTGNPVGLGTSWNSRLSATAGERVAFFNPAATSLRRAATTPTTALHLAQEKKDIVVTRRLAYSTSDWRNWCWAFWSCWPFIGYLWHGFDCCHVA